MGIKWVERTPLRGFVSVLFSGYGMLGGVYQRLVFEDGPETKGLIFGYIQTSCSVK